MAGCGVLAPQSRAGCTWWSYWHFPRWARDFSGLLSGCPQLPGSRGAVDTRLSARLLESGLEYRPYIHLPLPTRGEPCTRYPQGDLFSVPIVHSALGNVVLTRARQLGKKAIEVYSTEIPTEGSFTNKQIPGLPLMKHRLQQTEKCNFSDQDRVHCLIGRSGAGRRDRVGSA